jgi:hypothetical protein
MHHHPPPTTTIATQITLQFEAAVNTESGAGLHVEHDGATQILHKNNTNNLL